MAPQTTSTPRLFYGWIVLAACSLIILVSSGTTMVFGVFTNPMVADLGWSHSTLSFSYVAMPSRRSSVAWGSWRWDRLFIPTAYARSSSGVVSSMGWVCISPDLTSTVTTVGAFYFWYGGVASLGRSVFMLTSVTLITRWFEKRRATAMGLTRALAVWHPLFFIFAPLLTWVILRWDWQTAFAAQSLVMTAVVVLMCMVLRDHPHQMGLRPYGAPPDTPPPKAASQAEPACSAGSARQLWRRILHMQGCWTLALINFFCCVCHSVPLVHVVGFAQSAGLSAFTSAWVLGLMSLSSTVGRVAWGVFADRHGARLTLIVTLLMQGTLVLWLINTQDPVIFFLYAVVWGFGFGGVNTQYGVVARELYGARHFGPGYAGQMCFSMGGMAVGGFLGGYLYDLSHSYVTSWLISFGAGLISSLLAMDLLLQGDRGQTPQAAKVTETADSAQTPNV